MEDNNNPITREPAEESVPIDMMKSDGRETGENFVKKIRPIGVIFFLFLFAVFLFICFSSFLKPVKDYEAPNTSEYYARSAETLEELKTELDSNFLPYVDGAKGTEIADGRIVVHTEERDRVTVRSAVLRYYDESLFDFVADPAEQ